MMFRRFVLTLLLLLFTRKSTIAKPTKEKNCQEIHVSGKSHKKEEIAIGIDRPYQLSFYENYLYFSYNVGNSSEDTFEIGIFKDNELKRLRNITNGFATAIDRGNKIAYFGGSEGIYEKDLKKKDSKVKHVLPGNIWDLFFHHHLYFIVYPSQRLYKKVRNESETVDHIKEKIYQFAIDGNNNTFYTTKSGLHVIKNGTKDSIHYDEPKVFRAIEVDRKGKAYFCGTNGIYIVNDLNETLTEIAHIKNIFGLTFDSNNNIIYSNPHEINRLIPGECK